MKISKSGHYNNTIIGVLKSKQRIKYRFETYFNAIRETSRLIL